VGEVRTFLVPPWFHLRERGGEGAGAEGGPRLALLKGWVVSGERVYSSIYAPAVPLHGDPPTLTHRERWVERERGVSVRHIPSPPFASYASLHVYKLRTATHVRSLS